MPEYFQKIGAPTTGLLYIMLNLETTCSLRCPKCALPGRERKTTGKPLTFEDRAELLMVAQQAGCRALVIIGAGEPTENFPMMRQLVRVAHILGLDTVLFSTASALTKEQAIFYRDHRTTFIVSLDSIQRPTYRSLTGNGEIDRTMANIDLLRSVYADRPEPMIDGTRVVRLGINTTVVQQNKHEIGNIRALAGDDMFFVANPPIRRGVLASSTKWNQHVGDSDAEYEELERIAQQASETGSHSSVVEGVCGYLSRGVSFDVDGEMLCCGYGGETAEGLGHARNMESPEDLLEAYEQAQEKYRLFVERVGYAPSCPLRDPNYDDLVQIIQKR